MKKFHVVKYVDDCVPVIRKFKTLKAMEAFVTKFQKKNPTHQEGFWIDYTITDLTNDQITFYDEIEVLE